MVTRKFGLRLRSEVSSCNTACGALLQLSFPNTRTHWLPEVRHQRPDNDHQRVECHCFQEWPVGRRQALALIVDARHEPRYRLNRFPKPPYFNKSKQGDSLLFLVGDRKESRPRMPHDSLGPRGPPIVSLFWLDPSVTHYLFSVDSSLTISCFMFLVFLSYACILTPYFCCFCSYDPLPHRGSLLP
jgi:hypothetical protein